MKNIKTFCPALIALIFAPFLVLDSYSQTVGIGTTTPNSSSQLDITSTNKGLLLPRMNTASIASIAGPAKGLMIYDSVKNQLMVNMGSNATPNWQTVVFKSGWSLNGNSGTNTATDFIGTTDDKSLMIRVNNLSSGGIDQQLKNAFFGYGSGKDNSTGNQNAAMGYHAMQANTIGVKNTALGSEALEVSSTACCNVAIGSEALRFNYDGGGCTGVGSWVLRDNTVGTENTAVGSSAMFENMNGNYNTAVGVDAMHSNVSGSYNSAFGLWSMNSNRDSYNTAVGAISLTGTAYAQYNVAVGYNAGSNFNNGYNNVFVGANADVNGQGYYNVVCVGQGTIAGASSHARFGNAATVHYGGWANWSNLSDARFKSNIKENVPGLDFILKLRPVTYNIKATELDAFLHKNVKDIMSEKGKEVQQKALREKEAITYTGFVAQEVESVAKQLRFDFSGVEAPANDDDTYSLRYAEFVVPLVKAVQEQQSEIEFLKKLNVRYQTVIEDLRGRLDKMEAAIKLKTRQ